MFVSGGWSAASAPGARLTSDQPRPLHSLALVLVLCFAAVLVLVWVLVLVRVLMLILLVVLGRSLIDIRRF